MLEILAEVQDWLQSDFPAGTGAFFAQAVFREGIENALIPLRMSEQGALQGALTSLMSLTTIIGPLIMNNLFTYFTHKSAPFYFPGASFFLGAIFMLGSTIIIYSVFRKEKHQLQTI